MHSNKKKDICELQIFKSVQTDPSSVQTTVSLMHGMDLSHIGYLETTNVTENNKYY